jgi:hypothetical protein
VTADQYLVDLGLVTKSGEASKHFASHVPSISSVGEVASEFVERTWAALNSPTELSNNLRGTTFELLIGVCLVKAGLVPFFRQAEVTYVNNARFDYLLWESGWNPISISIKTSLRERYKQAELEGGALKNVHRKSENYLVTLAHGEVKARRKKLAEANQYSNLNLLVLADTVEFDELIDYLQSKSFAKPASINPMANDYTIDI